MRGRRRRFVSTFRRFSSAKKLSSFLSYVVGLRFKRQGIREIVEVCILTLGHSCSRTYASYPSCATAYPLGSVRVCSLCVAKNFLYQRLETRLFPYAVVNRI